MTKVLLDINVVLDVLLDRKPHIKASAAVWTVIETGAAEGFLPAHGVTTIHYLVRREQTAQSAQRVVAAITRVFRIATVDESVVRRALELGWSGFEAAIMAAAAERAACDLIVTRDPAGFRNSQVRVVTPEIATVLLKQADPV